MELDPGRLRERAVPVGTPPVGLDRFKQAEVSKKRVASSALIPAYFRCDLTDSLFPLVNRRHDRVRSLGSASTMDGHDQAVHAH